MQIHSNAPAHLQRGPAAGPPVGPGRVYSVWRWDLCEYDYYYDPAGPSDAGGWLARPTAAKTSPWSVYGDPVENVLTELPLAAVLIGQGAKAWGEIAVKDRAATLAMRNTNLGQGQRGYAPIMDSGLSGLRGLGVAVDAPTGSDAMLKLIIAAGGAWLGWKIAKKAAVAAAVGGATYYLYDRTSRST